LASLSALLYAGYGGYRNGEITHEQNDISPRMAGMKLFKRRKNLGEPVLTLRLWDFTGSAILNLVIFTLLAAYLLPLAYTPVTSLKEPAQMSAGSEPPLYPAINPQYHYQGIDYPIMDVPTADGVKQWAMVKTRRTYAEFIDPQNPDRGLIHW